MRWPARARLGLELDRMELALEQLVEAQRQLRGGGRQARAIGRRRANEPRVGGRDDRQEEGAQRGAGHLHVEPARDRATARALSCEGVTTCHGPQNLSSTTGAMLSSAPATFARHRRAAATEDYLVTNPYDQVLGKRHSWMPFDRGASGTRSTSGRSSSSASTETRRS